MTREQDTARRIVDALDYGASRLDEGTTAKLAAARNEAVAVMAQPAYAPHTENAIAGLGRYLVEHMHGPRVWMPMAVTLAALLALVVVLQQNGSQEPLGTDALLLASDLPPQAYVDKGFDEWLESSPRL